MTKTKKKNHKTGNHVSVPRLAQFQGVRRAEMESRKFILTLTGTGTSSGTGTLGVILTMDPSGSNDWLLIGNYYDEFRVIGIKVTLVSLQQYSVTASNALLVAVYDNDSSALLTLTTATQYVTKVWVPAVFAHNNGRVWSHKWARPVSASSPIPWVDVANPANSVGSFQLISGIGALSNSTNYFNYAIEWMVEARGRR